MKKQKHCEFPLLMFFWGHSFLDNLTFLYHVMYLLCSSTLSHCSLSSLMITHFIYLHLSVCQSVSTRLNKYVFNSIYEFYNVGSDMKSPLVNISFRFNHHIQSCVIRIYDTVILLSTLVLDVEKFSVSSKR